ncbi:TadE/TadG family type IV pilus assembly protein [Celeribacter indicus]|uniref:TadE-like domain-containing protein n=1 Tax=Celeribacter indicus TaxID=1208324 RepID=A0A0B5E730_9RHOB|nr:TadE/TadG family type IV pilus assembly protein [Celeribacter indicus]AJE48841.1 hypothetical protein P73_4126 [Celeribacter indicus]SDW38843.1 TadE-like protein [Celeribacter indicus]
MRRLQTFTRQDDGATAVEFALVLPFLLSVIFGIVCFGQYFALASSVQQLAAEAARASVVQFSPAAQKQVAEDFIRDARGKYAALDGARLDVAVQMESLPVSGITVTLSYDLAGTAVEIAADFLNLQIPAIVRSSYLAY